MAETLGEAARDRGAARAADPNGGAQAAGASDAEMRASRAVPDHVAQLARLYLVLSRTNRAIERARDERSLLQEACEIVVDVGGFRMSWAAMLDAPPEHAAEGAAATDRAAGGEIVPSAWAGHEDGYLAQLKIGRTGKRSKGPTGEAVASVRTVICGDVATDPRMEPWREEALRRGYRASIGLPLLRSDEIRGVLTVYAETPNAFGLPEVELLEELARDVSLGLSAIEDAREWRRAEAALRASDERFETSIDTLLDPFVILRAIRDEGGGIVDFVYDYANEAACLANRMAREKLVGMRLLALLPEHESSGLLASYARVVETGTPLVIDDLDYVDTWGGERSHRVFDIRASKLGDGLAYTWRDVTERRAAERRRAEELEERVRERTAELEVARERAYAIAALSTAMAEATDPRDIAERLLQAARRVGGAVDGVVSVVDGNRLEVLGAFGLPPDVARRLRSLPKAVLTPIRDAARSGQPLVIGDAATFDAQYPELGFFGEARDRVRLVLPLRTTEVSVGGVSLGFPPPRSLDQAEVAFFMAIANTTAHTLERLHLVEAEREARGMLESVVAQMPAGVSVAARGRGILYQNEAVRRIILGPAAAEELASRGAPPATPADGRPSDGIPANAARSIVRGMRADGRPYGDQEWPIVRSLETGEVVVNEEIPIARPDGSRAVLMITSAPVHDAAGEIVAAVAIVLDVTERKEAEQLRDAFLGVLSHELRTPVTTIYGGARLLLTRGDRLADDVRADLLSDIAAESERLSRLVDDLLVLARAERGVDMSVRGAALVQHRLRSVIDALAREWPDRRFECHAQEQVPPVTGDEAYVEQVLRNLIGNAAKYGRREVITTVRVRDRMVEVSVEDDGPGIEPAELESVFDLFARSKSTAMVPGAGIGLFVARRLVEAMGGRLWAGNRPEGGAVFTFVLPEFGDQ